MCTHHHLGQDPLLGQRLCQSFSRSTGCCMNYQSEEWVGRQCETRGEKPKGEDDVQRGTGDQGTGSDF